MRKPRVLFVGEANGSRSQMAEALLRHLAGDRYEAHSAGFRHGSVHPLSVRALAEVGIDISGARTKTAFELYTRGIWFDHIIILFDPALHEQGPIYPGFRDYEYWRVENPDEYGGDVPERLEEMRYVRDELRGKIEAWVRGQEAKGKGGGEEQAGQEGH